MTDAYSRWLTIVGAVGAGISAGVYFAFATFVMPGLRRVSHSQAISAMNGINKSAPASPLLMLALFGTGIVCVLLMISGFRNLDDPKAAWVIAGAALYIVSVLITVMYHVPHNDQLLKVDPNGAGAGSTWSHFYSSWMAWNTVRTLTAAGGTVGLVLALRAR
jgi:uncharacterized membrane protein